MIFEIMMRILLPAPKTFTPKIEVVTRKAARQEGIYRQGAQLGLR